MNWWLEDQAFRVDWWPGAESYGYVYQCPLVIVLAGAACLVASLAFATWRLQRHGWRITLW